MFDELLNDYTTQLELFEAIEFQERAELATSGFEELKDLGLSGANPAENGSVVELIETSFTPIRDEDLTRLNFVRL